ncbi:hypothetical protein Patl1_35200 [Pistacia atlantica]|uniref:Uncharacterized protein n=1 Tax=Pistacia atlantica TaxID=434234 RepID=A0ACC0ZS07_9ROSI|nr:hypothetical protein Patl1_35200 [Pistacia atlantica]
MLQKYPSAQQGTPYQVQGQTASPGMNHIQSGMEKHSNGHAKFSSIEVQLSMQSPVLTTPLYATAGTYMPSGNPFYPNFQPSAVYALHYNAGGYALNSAFLPAFVAGYPPHGPVPMPFDSTKGPSINIQTTGISTAENIPRMGDLQHQKFYGHHVMMLQPSFVNPLQTQYFQHPFGDAYGASVQYVRLPSSNGTGAQVDSSILKEPPSAAYLGDQKLLSPPNGSLGMGVMAQFPVSPISSPLLPSLPVGGTSHPGQRGVNIFDDPKRHSFLEELKSSNAQKLELSDIPYIMRLLYCLLYENQFACISHFNVDQHGSQLIQQKLEHCSFEDKVSVFKEVLPHASKLMTNIFGIILFKMYAFQQYLFFEHGSPEQRKELAEKLVGQMLPLSLQIVLEHCSDEQQGQCVVDGTLESAYVLAQEQYGNYVTQVACSGEGKSNERGQIISKVAGKIVQLSQHKYASNVVEKCLEYGDAAERELLIEEIIGQYEENDNLLFLNFHVSDNDEGPIFYVVKKILEKCNDIQRAALINRIKVHCQALKKYTYGKHIVARFEQLYGEGT